MKLRDLGDLRFDVYSPEELMKLPPSKAEARVAGVPLFYTGKPCLRGHASPRYTKGGRCVACTRLRNGHSEIGERAAKRAVRIANAGKGTYVPLAPCKHGHKLRFTASNNCVECDRASHARHALSGKYSRIKKEYGISRQQYEAMVDFCGGACWVCKFKPESHFSLHIDHCHESGGVRGLLCQKCNQALGLMRNDPRLLRRLAEYADA